MFAPFGVVYTAYTAAPLPEPGRTCSGAMTSVNGTMSVICTGVPDFSGPAYCSSCYRAELYQSNSTGWLGVRFAGQPPLRIVAFVQANGRTNKCSLTMAVTPFEAFTTLVALWR